MSNFCNNPKNSKRVREALSLGASRCKHSPRDRQDELAWLACEERRLRNALLKQEMVTRQMYLRLQLSRSKRRGLRADCILLFAVATLLGSAFGSRLILPAGVLLGLVVLAGWTIRATSDPCPDIGLQPKE